MKLTLANLRQLAGVPRLLSEQDSNPKIAKNVKAGQLTAVLHLAPGNMSGHEVCPKRSAGCSNACLHFAGSPVYQTVKTRSRIKKTQLFFRNRDLFMNLLMLEIEAHARAAKRKGLQASVRLNGTSDIVWEKKTFANWRTGEVKDIIRSFPDMVFYDYTKIPMREEPVNYFLTFSLAETNDKDTLLELARGRNVAVVFEKELPRTFWGRNVIDGDEHDYRPADPRGVIVGLKAKGSRAKEDSSGFVLPPVAWEMKMAA